MKSLSLMSFLSLFTALFCQSSFAELSPSLKVKLDEALAHYSIPKPIESSKDQVDTLKSATGLLRSKIFSLGLGADLGMWVKVFNHISQTPDAPMSAPVREAAETEAEFQGRHEKHILSEQLRKDLLQYFHSKFPIQAQVACLSPASAVGSQLEALALNVGAVGSQVGSSLEEERVGGAPHLTGAMLFVELNGESHYKGWNLHAEKLQTLRGTAGYEFLNRTIHAGDSSANQTMVALSDSTLGQLPLYQVNQNPVTLTDSKESQEFFKDLPNEIKKKTDGTWVGYRYVFFRDALINTERYTDPEVRKPFSIYLMKKVKPETGKKHVITPEDQKEFQKAIKKEKENQDLLQAALKFKRNTEREPQVRKRDMERAVVLLKRLAKDEKLGRAQYELALMYRDGVGVKRNVEKGKEYAALALSQGYPEISFNVPEEPVGKEGQRTKTGAFYELIPHHPTLGKAWKDPRGVIWSDQVEKKPNGEELKLNWEQAKEYCLNKNSPERREAVKQKLAEREALLSPLRKAYYDLPFGQRTEEAAQHIRNVSHQFGPIPGCYLANREENEGLGIDRGYSRNQSQYSPEIFSALGDRWFWSSSGDPNGPDYAFFFYGGNGVVGYAFRDNGGSVRCACGSAAW